MGKYLRKYNKETGIWEILSPNYSNDIFVTNPSLIPSKNAPQTLDTVLTTMNDDIVKLKQNVSWLAEHGGGGNGLGGGSGTASYKFFIENGGNGDTLYVSSTPYTINFKIIGGNSTDKVKYMVTYDGVILTSTYVECRTNAMQSIVIPNFTEGVSMHLLQFDGIDADGIAFEPRIITILESSLQIRLTNDIINFDVNGDNPIINVLVTNKAINSETVLTLTNLNSTITKNFNFTTDGANEEPYSVGLYTSGLIDKTNVQIGKKYTFAISAYTDTSNGIRVESDVLYPEIWFKSDSSFAIVVEGATPIADIGNIATAPIIEVGSNFSFAFTVYHGGVPSVYYAIVLSKSSGETKQSNDIEIYGDYYATTKEKLLSSEPNYSIQSTGYKVSKQISISNDNSNIGVWYLKIKCWSTDFAVSASSINVVEFKASNLDVFTTQKPIKKGDGLSGDTLYMEFDIFSDNANNKIPNNNVQNYWTTSQSNYFGYSSSAKTVTLWTPTNTLNVIGTNGLQSGFVSRGNKRVLRFQGDAYGKINNPFVTSVQTQELSNRDSFTLSIAYKTDEHPTNDKTVFEWCRYNAEGLMTQGIKVTLEEITWNIPYHIDEDKSTSDVIKVNIQQNVENTIDFVFIGKNSNDDVEKKGIAKIFVNGILNAAVEVGSMDTSFVSDMYIACSNINGNLCNFSDIDFYSLRLFTSALDDLQIIVNAHNSVAERKDNGQIDNEKYKDWKIRNFLDSTNDKKPTSLLYNNGKYDMGGLGYNSLKSVTPLPLLLIDASDALTSENGNEFSEKFFFTSYGDKAITAQQFSNCSLYYYDNNNGKDVEIQKSIKISLQGTSSVTYRSKNLEIYLEGESEGGYTERRTKLFQPRSDWFPESQFTLKADVVDSAHANNAVLGKWINELRGEDLMKQTPGEFIVEQMPPEDKVLYNNEEINHNIGETTIWAPHTGLKIKNTLEGFPILLLIKFKNQPKETLMGIYSFNLGRYSFYNLGLKFFKYFSRRRITENGIEPDNGCPAVIDFYDYYKPSEPITCGGQTFYPKQFASFEFGGGANHNIKEHPTWSQFDLNILSSYGEFIYHGPGDNPLENPAAIEGQNNGWLNLQELFRETSQCNPQSQIFSLNSSGEYVGEYDGDGKPKMHARDATSYEKLLERLCVPNAMTYYVICSIFGMIDSLGKNFTLRTWNCDVTNPTATQWYPCFYDMDTALGLDNQGTEKIKYDSYVDKYANSPISWVSETAVSGMNTIAVSMNHDTPTEQNPFTGFNGKLWRILRRKNDTSTQKGEVWSESKANDMGSDFKRYAGYAEHFYEDVYLSLRREGGKLNTVDDFIKTFTEQTQKCGEILFNLDYNLKYLTEFEYADGDATVTGLGNIKMLHGNRKEYVRNWLLNRLTFLDGVFELENSKINNNPMSLTGSLTLAGNPTISPYPYFTFMTTRPTFFSVSVGQSAAQKYYVKPYEETLLVFNSISNDVQVTINNTSLISLFDNLKNNRLSKFEALTLPKLTNIDFSGIETFITGTPIQFHTAFTFDSGLKEDGKKLFSSNVRKIDMSNTKQGDAEKGSFVISLNTKSPDDTIVYNFDKLKHIDISNSCVKELILPSAILETLNVTNSDITQLSITNQPLLDEIDVSGCKYLTRITIKNCELITNVNFSNMTQLEEVIIENCRNLNTAIISGNSSLTSVKISDCESLSAVTLNGNKHSDLSVELFTCDNLVTFNATGLTTTKMLVLPLHLEKLTTFNIYEWRGLSLIRYGSSVEEYANFNNISGGIHQPYEENGIKYNVLDLTPMTKITSLSLDGRTTHYEGYRPFIGSNLNLQYCSAIQVIKFRNDKDKPFILTKKEGFKGCTSLVRVLGHIVLHGENDFDGCLNFKIHNPTEYALKDNYETMATEFKTFKTGGYCSNLRVSSFSGKLSSTFSNTSCSLYDAYYILNKCTTENNKLGTEFDENISFSTISNVFAYCKNIVFDDNINLDKNAYRYCTVTNSFTNPFYSCSGIGQVKLYSPSFSNSKYSSYGTLTYILECGVKSLNEIYGYCDENLFKLEGTKVNSVSGMSFCNFYHCNMTSKERVPIDDYKILKDLPNIKKLSNSFNSLHINFTTSTIYIHKDGNKKASDNECTKLFFSQTQLEEIYYSFNAIYGNGVIRNIFGCEGCKQGYASSNSNNIIDIYPQSLHTVINSFNFSGSTTTGGQNPRLYITEDFFQNIKTTLQYFSSGRDNGCSAKNFVFNGNIIKRLGNEDTFPYNIFNGCTALKEIPGFFANLEIQKEDGLVGVTLPNYSISDTSTSMFKDCRYLTNIGWLFYNMKNIEYELNGYGFANCNLVNVSKCFGYESASHSNNALRRKGMIPYGLFYKKRTISGNTMYGFTEEMAAERGITEDYGIINAVWKNGRVTKEIVKDDREEIISQSPYGLPKILSGNTYPDHTVRYVVKNTSENTEQSLAFEYEVDEYGVIQDGIGIGEMKNANDSDFRSKDTNTTAFTNVYNTYAQTIQDMSYCFQYNDGKGLTSYEIKENGIDRGALIVDNENYNTIKYILNPNYDPILYNKKYDSDNKRVTFEENPNYDPRRYLYNTNWNKCSKKGNKYYYDGVNEKCYDELNSDPNVDKQSLVPFKDYHSIEQVENGMLIGDLMDNGVNDRKYAFAPDLLLYCADNTNLNIQGLFLYAGGPSISIYDTNSTRYKYLNYGIRGTLPPYMLETLTNLKNITYLFKGCRGILPDKWGRIDRSTNSFIEGRILPATLFVNNKSIENMTGAFSEMVFYPTTYLRPDSDVGSNSDYIFKGMRNLRDLTSCFEQTVWLGTYTNANVNPLNNSDYSQYNISRNQLKNKPFENLNTLQTVEKMFASNKTKVNHTYTLTDLQCFDSTIFGTNKTTFTNAKNIFNGCYNLKLELKTDDLLKFWDNKNVAATDCYKNCQDLYTQLNVNGKWNNGYLQYFGPVSDN